ncbi:MAG: gamma-glutamyltransferase family protein [Actinobacteria bacterium]|nr:gamma-glutamyltransferase family protein [Actinomycetota bacterium]
MSLPDVLTQARRFPNGCVTTPHHLASAAGATVLSRGGNAVDAAVAANLVLGVVTPYHCGPGGDLFAIVWDGRAHGVSSDGAAPAGATPDAVASAVGDAVVSGGGMPRFGPLPVTVPGAVAGWAHLLERWGTRSFGDLAAPAIDLARDGFEVSAHAARYFLAGRDRYRTASGWSERFGDVEAGTWLVQEDHARALELVAADGPGAVYGGPIGERIVEVLQAGGSTMTLDDLRGHEVRTDEPLRGAFRDLEVLELAPPTQGVTALEALAVADALGPLSFGEVGRVTHLHVEAARAAMADRDRYVTDPAAMTVDPTALFAPSRARAIADAIDPERAAPWPAVTPHPGGTAHVCAADRDGLLVSLIQSNYMGFGSGEVVPDVGWNLQNRGASFSLDPAHANVVAPGKRTMHTLIPSLVLRDGAPVLVLGTMGGDGQPQIHLQVLARIADQGMDVQGAVTAPRWVVDAADGAVRIEDRAGDAVIDGLRQRGHQVEVVGPYEHGMGHAHAIGLTDRGYAGATDPRAEGTVVGH